MLIENEPSEEQEHMFLSVFGYKADALNLIAIEKILNRFMEENPDIIVNYEGVKGIEYWKALKDGQRPMCWMMYLWLIMTGLSIWRIRAS